VEKL
jgi:hypothetical protein